MTARVKSCFGAVCVLLAAVLLVSCTAKDNSSTGEGYMEITAGEAKRYMDENADAVILDVREESEYAEGHIPGAILLPYGKIGERAEKVLPDKDALILVYCRSGRRSKIAANALVELGYTNVKEFGGIIDWPYDIVK